MAKMHELLEKIEKCNQQILEVVTDIVLHLKREQIQDPPEATAEDYLVENLFGEIPYRAVRSLEDAGIYTFGDLIRLSSEELQAVSGVGPVAYRKICRALDWRGMKLKNQ